MLWYIAAGLAFWLISGRATAAQPQPMPEGKQPVPGRAPIFQPEKGDAREAAVELRSYLEANPSALKASDVTVAALQARMGGLVADGMFGPKTRARAAVLGVTL